MYNLGWNAEIESWIPLMWLSHFSYIHCVKFWYSRMCIWWSQRHSFLFEEIVCLFDIVQSLRRNFEQTETGRNIANYPMRLAPAFNKWIVEQKCWCLDYAFADFPHRFISTVVVAEKQWNTTRHCITLLPVDRPRQKLWINSAQWWATVIHYIMAPSCV